MTTQDFLARCLFLDLEINNVGTIYHIGAVFGDHTFERKGRFDLALALKELDILADAADYILGHNILGHDLPALATKTPHLRLLHKPVVDTLYLSPLAFPENPYHRLVKDYKLVRDSLNNPVADARLAASVFCDQWQRFATLQQTECEILSFYRACFATIPGSPLRSQGLHDVFSTVGATGMTDDEALVVLRKSLRGKACITALALAVPNYLADCRRRPSLAYCLAWTRVAGFNSVLPPWVRHRFPDVVPMLRELRDIACHSSSCEWCQTNHHPREQLNRFFGYPAYRATPTTPNGQSLQEEIVRFGMSDRPHLAILPTGGGKSLCYQIPALVRNYRRGVLTIVISPLQALMKDQVDGLAAKTDTLLAAAIYGMLTPPERGEILERVRLGDIAILYVSPEQLRNKSLAEALGQREIGCWIFDEAHCLSKWGHDFRPDYLYASRFIREFAALQQTPIPPIACFTATAKREVMEEIVDHFRRELGHELQVFEGGVERSNLSFEVQLIQGAQKFERIHEILAEHLPQPEVGSGIVYAATRKETESIRDFLSTKGWRVDAFHAGLAAPEKRRVQDDFISGKTQVICATNAFGMGIDKDNVRLVIHASIPGSLENYIQEAGRAGRDTKDAKCVLLYNEQDIETQFQLGAFSELTQYDISQILKGIRRAKRNHDNQVVLTTGELLRDEEVNPEFDSHDRMADTKVKTAVSWLERSGFLERNQNDTRVFQGQPLVRSIEEAVHKIAPLSLPDHKKRQWLAILSALFNAKANEGMAADELAELPEFKVQTDERQGPASGSGDTQEVLRTLYAMSEAGLIKQGILLTAFIRYKVSDHSRIRLDKVCHLEQAMLKLMQESEPETDGWHDLSLRRLNQRLVNEGNESLPEHLRNLLKSLALDGKGLAGNRGSLEFRYVGQDHYRLRLNRDWPSLLATAEKRRSVAKVVLDTLYAKVPTTEPASAELLVNFSLEDIADALGRELFLAGQVKDALAAIDRALMFLHEQQVIILQQGLAVFRQAMTIRIIPEEKKRRYTKGDYSPLHQHYKERIFQVHVIDEYARLGIEKLRQALDLVLAYFTMERSSFIQRYFDGRKEIIDRATSQVSYHRIVDNLVNPVQVAVVAAQVEENMLVLAGPGSGKTRVIIHRCAYLLRVKRVLPRSILILCFNRNAAITLRRRLVELVGSDAKGVTVQTYHGLAMRLTGASFAERAEGGKNLADLLKNIIPEAVRLLNGHVELTCMEGDEIREKLLAGYRHILVDEYQDIDQDQYQLISAIAGRTIADPDSKLSLLVVGDDDQNIYTFRGANVAFIRRYQEDYQATVHYLVENYRSTAHIINAANCLIRHNQDRMKTDHAIRINKGREPLPPGGAWQDLDPLGNGRVQILGVADVKQQALALVEELLRLRQRNPSLAWAGCAVLARTREELTPVRAWCEYRGIPVSWGFDRGKIPPLHRLREVRQFLTALNLRHGELLSATDMLALADGLIGSYGNNSWWELLRSILQDWKEESANSQLSSSYVIEYIYESLAEQRRDHAIGAGVFLSTVHSAKGMEFPHVFVLGGWRYCRGVGEQEEERRAYYVAMTRARETLCLFERTDVPNPNINLLAGNSFLVKRELPIYDRTSSDILNRRYDVWGLEDLFLDYAGRRPESDQLHRHLARLKPGDLLFAVQKENSIVVHEEKGHPVVQLSKAAVEKWRARLPFIERITVLAMVGRYAGDSGDDYRDRCTCPQWEIPLAEVIFHEQS